MADEAAGTIGEASRAVFDLSLQTGAFGGFTVGIKIDNVWLAGGIALGGLSLAAFYISRRYPSQNAVRNALEGNVGGEADPEVRAIDTGSILVELFCHTKRSFMSFVDDFEANRVKRRLGEEFNKIGYKEEVEVTIINHQEVYEKVNHIRRRKELRFLLNRSYEALQAINIGIVVANFLFNTGQVLKSIQFWKECWILLFNNATVIEGETVKFLLRMIYTKIFLACFSTNEFTRVIQYGRKLLNIHRYYGEIKEESKLSMHLAMMCHRRDKYPEAKEFYEKAINITEEVGDHKGEGYACAYLGMMYESVGDHVKATEFLHKALAIAQEIGDKKAEASAYGQLGAVFQVLGDFCKALGYLEKMLAITKETGDRHREASAYGNLGSVCQSVGEYVKAEEYLQKALQLSKEIGDRRGEALVYGNLGSVFQSVGEYVKAEEHLQKALPMLKEIGDEKGEALAYGNLGSVFQSVGEYVKAEEYLQKALQLSKEIGDRRREALAYGNLGSVFQSVGEYVKAEEYLQKALQLSIEIGDIRGEALVYGNLGCVFQSVGEYVKAGEYLEKALLVSREIGDKVGEASANGNLGSVFQSVGEYLKAKEYLHKALQLSREVGDRRGEALAYGNLGCVFQSVGEYVKAEEHLQKALPMLKEIGDRKGEASVYGSLGSVCKSINEYVKAKGYLQSALHISKEIGDRVGEASAYGKLGSVFQSLGEYAKAEENLHKALNITKEIGNRMGEASALRNLGSVFGCSGEYLKATEYLQEALDLSMNIGDSKGEASSWASLGTVSLSLCDYGKAKEHFEKAVAITQEIGDRDGEASAHGNLGTVCQRVGEYAEAERHNEIAFSISTEIGDREKVYLCLFNLSWLKFLAGKIEEAFVYLRTCIYELENIRSRLRDDDQAKISFFHERALSYSILSALLCAAGKTDEALYALELGRARALSDLISDLYELKEAQITADPQSWVGIENIMTKEKNCTCLYLSYSPQRVFLWILKTTEAMAFRESEVIISDAVYPELSRPQLELPATFRLIEEDDENDEEELNLSWYKMLIEPVADLLEEPEIIIVPDRVLHGVKFAALRDEKGEYLSETFRIRIVPSLTILKLIQNSPEEYHSQSGALIVGDPEVGRVMHKERLLRLHPLPSAREEARKIGRMLGVQPFLGEQATKQKVLENIQSVSLIHFAVHCNAEGEMALAPTRPIVGIPQERDYLLTMNEISQVRVRAKLVVLSCCHGATGQNGFEGINGIARAFLGAGARSVLVAAEAVQDEATLLLMSRFYENLVHGESASESLHQAMNWMRRNGYTEPCHWASFMLIGDNVTFDFGK